MTSAWQGFTAGDWQKVIDVRNFIQLNYQPYQADAGFLAPPTVRTRLVWDKCRQLLQEETVKGVLDIDTGRVCTITSHQPGYIDKDNEVIFGLQTDAPLRRGVIISGGVRMAEQACEAYGYQLDPRISDIYREHCTTHNAAVFRAYTDDMRQARRLGVITGLPDAYGRGRIIGDYRRVALYGIDRLIAGKQADLAGLAGQPMSEAVIRSREEINKQIKALQDMLKMALSYGYDIARPAQTAKEAVQWVYFGYLAGIKEQNGAAMSLGRVSSFLDIYLERDIAAGVLDESGAQELIDQLVIKLRLARHLRTPEYNELFAGDPLWVTEAIGGMGQDGRTLVTRTSFRMLHTLYNLGPAPEPNLTILWSPALPEGFKQFCARLSIDTSAVQYENDDVMQPVYGDDYGIACCVSAMKIGRQMQLFGARANLAKALLMAINGGRDENTGEQIAPVLTLPQGEYLDYDLVRANYSRVLAWLAGLYVNTMNIIHFMHDKYAYEASQMALHDSKVERLMAFGIAGLSVAVDSLSAIRYGRVQVVRNAQGLATGFIANGDFPCFGNHDARVDCMANELTGEFIAELRKHPAYRESCHTLSVLTITSNVMYGKKTGATPDGRAAGEAFAPGANPMHGRDRRGALAAIGSITSVCYENCRDGISYTFSIVPAALGKTQADRVRNLTAILDGYAEHNGHHINVNVFDRSLLEAAMAEPEKYPQLTIRVSGYAVNFVKLSPAHQREVISRTFYQAV
ncbi:formate C-acetyltransferase|uniref:Formate acetyltransferase n=1 Tax=Dendrosporobacter quercicolus TaxID=146817 RepID=A0A1G9Y0C5_9FIRM|nr:formate C-acetyltransferase [Dendrosporobacter quercicolus]NSL49040.1 formate C-acetyltransferase [Dendrosporobacter quercicolus DSM 1736]SDN01863.1 formate C-acetyltransferase [Dendrosporobacter quercicolus]